MVRVVKLRGRGCGGTNSTGSHGVNRRSRPPKQLMQHLAAAEGQGGRAETVSTVTEHQGPSGGEAGGVPKAHTHASPTCTHTHTAAHTRSHTHPIDMHTTHSHTPPTSSHTHIHTYTLTHMLIHTHTYSHKHTWPEREISRSY